METDHVALVVPRLETVLERLGWLEAPRGPIEAFEGEGTREVYLGEGAARLLLVQPTTPESPYRRALEARGPGLHHVGVRVPDLDAWLGETSGWLLHPVSLRTVPAGRTAWLARPGVDALLEVQEGEPSAGPALVEAVEVPGALPVRPLAGLSPSPDAAVWLTLGGRRLDARALAAGEG